jgi:hypothetical protein
MELPPTTSGVSPRKKDRTEDRLFKIQKRNRGTVSLEISPESTYPWAMMERRERRRPMASCSGKEIRSPLLVTLSAERAISLFVVISVRGTKNSNKALPPFGNRSQCQSPFIVNSNI